MSSAGIDYTALQHTGYSFYVEMNRSLSFEEIYMLVYTEKIRFESSFIVVLFACVIVIEGMEASTTTD
jgi:hypothetical protein